MGNVTLSAYGNKTRTGQVTPRIIYNQAVDAMRDAFQEFHEMMAYGEFCEVYAGKDASQYTEAYDEIITAERRPPLLRPSTGRKYTNTRDSKVSIHDARAKVPHAFGLRVFGPQFESNSYG
ncbi:hypothetical protein G7054_g12824 [Neopestalotiopsis clavispora]|nr:hypothetical protein G7054_g12824 [Neopestalotiopsis clavispora]